MPSARIKRIRNIAPYVIPALSLLVLIIIAYIGSNPQTIGNAMKLQGYATSSAGSDSGDEYIRVEVNVGSWKRLNASWLQGDAFWTVNEEPKSSVVATVTVSISYKGIKPLSLNISLVAVWLTYGTAKSYIVNTSAVSLNTGEDGTVEKQFSGSKDINACADELGIPQDFEEHTVSHSFRVIVIGVGARSGKTYTADTGVQATTPPSSTWQWYEESATLSLIHI